jgi:methylated-DNA-protein-cysteine methyltransferase-like protein
MRASPPDLLAFNLAVWDLVKLVPPGKVITYGRIAALLPAPADVGAEEYRAAGPRWVGAAMAACPDEVPWQRVINAQGKISERRGGGTLRQRQLLEEEGVVFDEHERVDLKKYSWSPDSGDPPDQLTLI